MMLVKKNFKIMPALVLILISIVLSGCSTTSEPVVVKTGNVNQASTVSSNDAVLANANVAFNNGAPVNSPNASMPAVNNTFSAAPPVAGKDKKSATPAPEIKPQIGSGGADMFLFTQVRSALGSDPELLNAVIVEIKEGGATMTGSVSSQAQKTKAGQLIQSVQGIKSVKNNLRVAP